MDAGARVFAISVDPPGRNAAMVEKLSLPFPYLSDPDRSQAIIPYGVADEKDERKIARPSIVLVTPGQRGSLSLRRPRLCGQTHEDHGPGGRPTTRPAAHQTGAARKGMPEPGARRCPPPS